MTSAIDDDPRRRLLRILHDDHSSRKEVLLAVREVPGLELWLHSEASRAGLERPKLDTALARLGMRWASHVVKRFFLSPQSAEATRAKQETMEPSMVPSQNVRRQAL